jgi:type IV secretory pathway VirD2 relaxase
VSPEQGARLELDDYVRTVMRQVEEDLKTKLEWYGVSHHNTDNAHAHVVLRGMDDSGKPLLISREYLSHGLRNVAEREASVRLGMREPEDLDRGIEKMLFEERFTWIDKQLVKERDLSGEGIVRVLPISPEAREFAKKARLNKLKRLAFLESKGLCHEERTGVWKVAVKLEEILRELGERRAVERLVAPSLAGREELKQDLLIHKESAEFGPKEVLGTVVAKNLIDELQDKRFILVSGSDGRNHFIPLGRLSESVGFECRVGQVVRVVGQKATKTRAEEVIHRYLGQREGDFSLERFKDHLEREIGEGRWALPAGLSLEEYLGRFATRCAALERAGLIEPLGAGSEWKIPRDVIERARDLDSVTDKRLKVSVIPESYRSVREEIRLDGASWLDRIVAEGHVALRAAGAFGLEVSRALKERAEILESRGQSQTIELYKELLADDEEKLKAKLTKEFSRHYATLIPNKESEGELLKYDLLSDGYRMVVGLEDGSLVTRAVPTREERMEVGTRVRISLIQDRERGTSSLKLTKISGDSRSKERSKTFKR